MDVDVRAQGEGAGPSCDDIELVRQVARGDRAALGALYDRHSADLVRAASFLVRRRSDAEDVVHDAFVEVWQRAGDYDPRRGTVVAWLRVRVRSRAVDRTRREARRDARRLARAPSGSRDAVVWTPAVEPALQGALSVLPPEQAQVLGLGYGAGLTCAEMARHLGLPVGTIKSRLAAGLRKLRRCMKTHEVARE